MNQTATTSCRAVAAASALLVLAQLPLSAQSAAAASPAPADQQVNLQPFIVTGSHIARLDSEGPEPIDSFTSADIATSGFQSLSDFLQAQSFNSGGQGNLLQTSTSGVGLAFSRGASTLNPRGLGAGNFLVLVDGRRPAGYANPDSNGATDFDLNSLPTQAIDHIDFLKDGASAIYGSDAITGVMNVVLKKNFSGVETDASVGGATNNPTVLTRRANLMMGSSDKNTSVLVDVSWYKQAGSSIDQYSRSASGNYIAAYGPVKGSDTESTQAFPAAINLTAAQAKAAGLTTGSGYYVVTGGQPTSTPALSQFSYIGSSANIPDVSRNDLTTQGLVPHQQNWNGFASIDHTFTSTISGFAQLIAADEQTNYLYAPLSYRETSVNVSPSFETAIPNNAQGGVGEPTLIIPAGNPYNPFGENLTSFMGRVEPDRPRRFDVESLSDTLTTGLKGQLPGDWTWESAFTYGHDNFTQVQENSLRADDLQNALNGTFYGFSGVYFNPFGPSNPALLNALFFNSDNLYKSTGYDGEVSASGPLFAMPAFGTLPSAGSVALAVGGEWHEDQLIADPDSSNLVGTNNGSPFVGSRTVASEYTELEIPVFQKYLELQLAARHEDYNDFGNTTKAKYAFSSQLTPFFKLRGSYSQSFKAPDLAQLDGGGISYSAATTDPLNPSVASQKYPQIVTPNPKLQPEEGKTIYFGGVFDLNKEIKGLSLTVDYTNITINDAIVPISTFTPAQIFQYFPKLVVRNANTNQISYFNLTPFNGTAYYYRGYDLALDYIIRNTPIGDFKFDVTATRVLYLGYNADTGAGDVNYAGHYGFGGEVERWTGNTSIGWITGPVTSTLSMLYKGAVLADANGTVAAGTAWGVNPIELFNATVSYHFPKKLTVSVSCDNLFNTNPPENGVISPSAGFDLGSYGEWAIGRFLSVKVSKEF
jgi:outer membrane receptor for ferrienterochelin and colicin